MKSFQLCRTITNKGEFYFVNSRRVTKDKFEETKFWMRMSCLQTTIKKGIIRHYCVATGK